MSKNLPSSYLLNILSYPALTINHQGKILDVNSLFLKWTEHKKKGIIQLNIQKIIPQWEKISIQVEKKGYLVNKKAKLIDNKGLTLPISLSLAILKVNPKNQFILIIKDPSLVNGENEKQQLLTKEIIRIQEEERSRIAMEIHDEFNQDLFAMKLNIQSLFLNSAKSRDQIKDFSNEIIGSINEIMLKASELSNNLSPIGLKKLGLTHALEELANIFQKRNWFKIYILPGDLDNFFPEKWDINLYRIIQEALNNISKHAKAKKVIIETKLVNKKLRVLIEDNGLGFNVKKLLKKQPDRPKLGLSIMKERALLLGGDFEIASKAGKGTTIKITIPKGPILKK